MSNEEQRTKNKERTAKVLYVRVTKAEWLAFHAEARAGNLSIQSWARSRLGLPHRRGYSYRLDTAPRATNQEPSTKDSRMSTDDQPSPNSISAQHTGQGASSQ